MLKIPFSRVSCSGNEFKYLEEVIKSGWLTTAGKAMKFEEMFVERTGAKYACSVNSCTAALHLGLEALGVQPGDKVFVPDMTFTASAEVIRYLNADPVFLDVEYETQLITPEILTEAIKKNPDVKYLIVVHYGGHPAEMLNNNGTGILDICKIHGIKVMEDAAHAFPASLNGTMVGNMADVTCFSFYANKTITTGEGGMLTTNDEEIYKRVKTMRLHGINRDVWDRFTSDKPSWEYDVVAPGYKYNMPDINAAIGIAQMEYADEMRLARQQVAEVYYREFSGMPMIDLPACKVPLENHAWHLFPVVLNENSPVSRNRFIELMSEAGVGTSVHYKPMHRMSYYREHYHLIPEGFPVAEKIWKGNVSLPIYPLLTGEEIDTIVATVKKILT
ncbi:DegT/DnrJ/EryC1/StrS family aminotransferase [Alkalitalea saponilacus]|uniref:dTDP-4-amino-4,6-dideoxygalactose transaminase n=1 Tax=Alkalitalea saponilacus TaxID=889453 RepID=A0A1T5HS60_9BACT|nr:DegT/DnrJ/EryC1/StrS family aminotransferase [Alkalitalea saponilacus]ASB48292.1 aminotransferase [Alkalitalea saponilacus]SKC23515.1 dTDP-4-amino-4,6-dideoxygalactose transaminase [Alkalitalea saponilacus]